MTTIQQLTGQTLVENIRAALAAEPHVIHDVTIAQALAFKTLDGDLDARSFDLAANESGIPVNALPDDLQPRDAFALTFNCSGGEVAVLPNGDFFWTQDGDGLHSFDEIEALAIADVVDAGLGQLSGPHTGEGIRGALARLDKRYRRLVFQDGWPARLWRWADDQRIDRSDSIDRCMQALDEDDPRVLKRVQELKDEWRALYPLARADERWLMDACPKDTDGLCLDFDEFLASATDGDVIARRDSWWSRCERLNTIDGLIASAYAQCEFNRRRWRSERSLRTRMLDHIARLVGVAHEAFPARLLHTAGS